ncbi:unnamed protein product [Prunus armeniaca]
MFSKFEFDRKLNPTFVERAFKLPLSSIRAYLKESYYSQSLKNLFACVPCGFVHVGSAGITRPDRPGLDLSKQPPAGKISREEVAHICVAALESPYASGETFEVKSVVPFSEPFTVDPQNPPPGKDYNVSFKTLKDGITGKEILEQDPLSVIMACNHFCGSAAHTVCSAHGLQPRDKSEDGDQCHSFISNQEGNSNAAAYKTKKEQALSVHYRQIVEAYRKLDYD